MASRGADLRLLARRRLDRIAQEPLPPEEEEALRKQGYRLVRLPGLRVLIRDLSMPVEAEE
jgi:hypothetical protein